MRQTLSHLALILAAVVTFGPYDSPPEVAASTVVQPPSTSAPTSSPPPTNATRNAVPTLEDLVQDAGLPDVFVEIARCESASDPTAVHLNPNGSRDHGLWQINDRWRRPLFETLDPYDPVDNAAMAALVFTPSKDFPPGNRRDIAGSRQGTAATMVESARREDSLE